MIRAGVGAVVAALAVALVVVLLVNARADRRRAEQARVGELAAIAQRELVHDPAAAAARPAARARARPGCQRAPEAVPQPAPLPGARRLPRTGPGDVLPARRGRWRRRGDDGRHDPGLGHRPRDDPHLPAVRRARGPAGRPGLRRGRPRRRPERLRPGVGGRQPDRAHGVQRQRPVGAGARVLPRRLTAGRGTPLLGGAVGHAGPVVAAATGRLAQQHRRPHRARRCSTTAGCSSPRAPPSWRSGTRSATAAPRRWCRAPPTPGSRTSASPRTAARCSSTTRASTTSCWSTPAPVRRSARSTRPTRAPRRRRCRR